MARVPENTSHNVELDNSLDGGDGQVTLDSSVVDAIGNALMAHYRELTEAPLPARFLVMLAELEAKERAHDQ